MTLQDSTLTTLIGSRICHDLISPLGAIGNGIELLQMSGVSESPEMALISESVQNANQRIRFFRIAFGAARAGQNVSETEIRQVLATGGDGRKVHIEWQPKGEQPRQGVKLAFLLIQCFESAMPWGGEVSVARHADSWTLTARAEKMKVEDAFWALLDQTTPPPDLPAAQVHFALVAPELADQGRTIRVSRSESAINIDF